MLLIYSSRITPRIQYVFNHIFKRVLQIPFVLTDKIESFVSHSGPKISYGKKKLGNEFFIQAHPLLLENGVEDFEVIVKEWTNTVPCFFETGKMSSIPFDIFAASFYLLSRYEEYLPHFKDGQNRFDYKSSLAYKYHFLEKPLVDIWAFKFFEILRSHFPDAINVKNKRVYNMICGLSVYQAYKFKANGLLRSLSGLLLSFFTMRWRTLWLQLMVIFKLKKDPFDTYALYLDLKSKYKLKLIAFFSVSGYTSKDRGTSLKQYNYRMLIKDFCDFSQIGLLASYFTMDQELPLKKECKKLGELVHKQISRSLQRNIRLYLPTTYRQLVDQGIEEDYSMGYHNALGFRASTCTPFYFYDLDDEIQTPLKLYSFVGSDTALQNELLLSPKKSWIRIKNIQKQIQQVNGTFVFLCHNGLLSNYKMWEGWQSFFDQVLLPFKNEK